MKITKIVVRTMAASRPAPEEIESFSLARNVIPATNEKIIRKKAPQKTAFSHTFSMRYPMLFLLCVFEESLALKVLNKNIFSEKMILN
jgi:hypothetical protein